MAIQHRRGNYSNFDPSKLLPGEPAVVQSGDPSASDGKAVYVAFAAGDVKRLATHEDIVTEIEKSTEEVAQDLTEQFTTSIQTYMNKAQGYANDASESATDAASSAEAAQEAVESLSTDKTLSVTDKPADAKATGDAIGELNGALTLLESGGANYTDGYNIASDGSLVAEPGCSVSELIEYTWSGDAYYYCNDSTKLTYKICFYDSNLTRLNNFQNPSAVGGSVYRRVNAETQVTGTPAYVRFSFLSETIGKIVINGETIWEASETAYSPIRTDVGELKTDVGELKTDVGGLTVKSQNLFDPEEYLEGYYVNPNTGNPSANANYGATGFIAVAPGDVLWWNCGSARYIAAYNSNKSAIRDSGISTATASGDYTVPDGVAFIRMSFIKSTAPEQVMINKGTGLLPYAPYGAVYINDDAINTIPASKITGLNVSQMESLLGSDSAIAKSDNLANGTAISIASAPWFIKKNVSISAVMKFNSFTSITIGKGYQNYRGRWILIDDTNVTPYYYNGTEVIEGTPVPHGLNISNYLQVTMFMTSDGVCRININTVSGTFSTTFDYTYEWNYAPFLFGQQAMTDVVLAYSCADLRCPLWLFGDSYMGVASNRVAGQLKNAGYFNYCINAIAGARSTDTGTPGKSSYSDLLRMLEFATPKYIIWSLGMNGGDANTINLIPTLISLCEEKTIELILYCPPSVPGIDHTSLITYVKSLDGFRYVDGNDAVGANSSGEWYGHGTANDMLSTDNVHPSAVGAKALAMRFLCDVPEIMQYGYSTGTVDGEIDGDEH